MSGDGSLVRRPRVIERPALPRGPLRDLKALVYELYLEAGTPSLDDMAAWVAADDGLAGAPERDTIHRIIRDPGVPPRQADVVAVVTVLARAARWNPDDAAGRARDLWVAARMDTPVGVPLAQVTDPFALEVHRPIIVTQTDELPPLTRYVRRAHDERLAQVVARAAGGSSAMAVLVAGSSAGKTRACWEALEPLRRAGGWRLWHPYDPTRRHAALETLGRVGPRTVVWLNETQDYLGGDDGERVAAKLRSLLADPARAPVLVLGTLWPEHHAALTQEQSSQVRQVLEGTVIEVPQAFTGTDLAELKQAAAGDARLAQAAKRADDGQITQYLAGGPALVQRFHTAPPAAKALICAAMDARRMGHRNALPHALLEQAAQAYLTDAQWDRLGTDWLEQALAYTSDPEPCKGAQGPVTPIRPDRDRPRTTPAGQGGGEPVYQLADYLDQYGRRHRAEQIPPIGFWTAAATHAHPDDLQTLAGAARRRGLYRDAAQLLKHATTHGSPHAAADLVRLLHALHPADHRPAQHAADHAALDNRGAVAMWNVGALEQPTALAEHAALDNTGAVADLLDRLLTTGDSEQVTTLIARNPARHAALDNPGDVAKLLDSLRGARSEEQVTALLARDPARHATLDNPYAVIMLLDSLREAGAEEQITLLAERVVDHVPLDHSSAVAWLLIWLRNAGVEEQVTTLLARDPAGHATLDDPWAVADLLDSLWKVGAEEQVTALLARDPARHAPLDIPYRVGLLLDSLWTVEAEEQVTALLARDPARHATLDNPYAVAPLLKSLQKVGAEEQTTLLAERAVAIGGFDQFLRIGDHQERFRFGREPDGSPATPWGWDDLR